MKTGLAKESRVRQINSVGGRVSVGFVIEGCPCALCVVRPKAELNPKHSVNKFVLRTRGILRKERGDGEAHSQNAAQKFSKRSRIARLTSRLEGTWGETQ